MDEWLLERLEMLVSNQTSFPSPAKKAIILHGKYGTGKTELARILPSLIEKNRVENFDAEGLITSFVSCQANDYASATRRAMQRMIA